MVIPRRGQQIRGGRVGRQPPGIQVERGLQISQRFGSPAENGIQRGEVIARFGLARGEAGEFLECNFEFGQVAQPGGNLSHGGNIRVTDVRIG